MAEDYFKFKGPLKSSLPNAGGAALRSLPTLGIVKSNIDPQRGGKIFVYLIELGTGDPDNSKNWTPVNYLSPFYGVTTPSSAETGWGNYVKNPNSYGVWNSPPDIGTTVICLFVDGKSDYGFYIGAIPPVESLHMVPAIGGSDNIIANKGEAKALGGATRLPVVNINTNNSGIADGANYLNEAKPVHSYVASVLAQQGLIRDTIRGVIGTTSQRETPSRVGWGVSTPGRPIYEGGFTDETIVKAAISDKQNAGLKVIARRGGHSLVMDDGDILGKDQLVRIRSSLGHQILMSDDGQCLHIIHANGQSWVELGKEGTIDMYSTNSVNIRTQGDLNLHADNNININAGKSLNMSADTIALSSEKQTTQKVGTNFSLYASGTYTTKVDGKMSFASGGDAFFYSKVITYINGSKINLNTGSSSLVPQDVKPIPITAHTDTLNDATKGWLAAPGKLLSIVSRAPAHAPWANANQGVDVKVNNSAAAALPSAPSKSLTSAIINAGAPTNPVTRAAISTVPQSSAISKNVTTELTMHIAATMKDAADKSLAADVVKIGGGIVQTANGPQAAFGPCALSAKQLQDCGILKPGCAELINSLVAGGKTLEQACGPFFTGVNNIYSLTDYKNASSSVIVDGIVTGMKGTLDKFTKNGVLSPNVSGEAAAPVILAGFNTGVENTVNYIKNAADTAVTSVNTALTTVADNVTGVVKNITDNVNGVVSNVTDTVNTFLGSTKELFASGNFAANVSTVVTGGLDSLKNVFSGGDALKSVTSLFSGGGVTNLLSGGGVFSAVTSLFGKKGAPSVNISFKGIGPGLDQLINNARGAVANAFNSIAKALPTLKPGVPQNIKDITEKAIATAQTPSSAPSVNSFTGAFNSITDAAKGVRGIVNSVTNTVNDTVAVVTNDINRTVTNLASNRDVSTGLSVLEAGEKGVSYQVNNADGPSITVPGIDAVRGLIEETSKITKSISNLVPSGLETAAKDVSSVLNKGLSFLKSGDISLVALVSSGLPSGPAKELNAFFGSLKLGGTGTVKFPTVASNNDKTRPLLNRETEQILDNPKIPPPNFTGNPATTGETLPESDLEIFNRKRRDQQKRYNDQLEITRTAKAALDNAVEVMPAGDPAIAVLKNQYETQYLKTLTITEELTTLT